MHFELTISGTFEITLLCIQFSKNKSGFHPELKAQSQKLKAPKKLQIFSFELSTLRFHLVEVNGIEPMIFPF